MYLLKILIFQTLCFLNFSEPDHNNPSPRTGPQDILVTHYDCEEKEQNTLHKYAKNQVTQCESEPQAIETRNHNCYTLLKSSSYNTKRIKIHSDIFRKESTLFSSLKRK